MGPENVKLLFQSFIECKRNQDEIDGPGEFAVEYDNPIWPHPYSDADSFVLHGVQPSDFVLPLHSSSLGPASVVPVNATIAGRELARMAREFSNSQPDKSIIYFKDICMVAEPKEQVILIPVLRKEASSQDVTTVSWKTCDKTALSGIHYVGSNGEIVFNKGETSKDIKIEILNFVDDSSFDDLRFMIELSCGVYNPKPMTVSLKKIANLYPEEKMVLDNLPSSLPISIPNIKFALDGCLNPRTLHMALTHLCSTSNVVDVQIALAFELCSLCLHRTSGSGISYDTIVNVLSDFFRMDNYTF